MVERNWDEIDSTAVPLSDVAPELAASLVGLFLAEVRSHLENDELQYLESIETAPRFDVTHADDGTSALRLTFWGSRTWVDWDGSDDKARILVQDMAASAAYSVSADHWESGQGWRSRTQFGDTQ